MATYSNDLRERVVQAYLNGEGSQRLLAQRFKISPTTVLSWVKRFRQTGSLDPAPHGGGATAKLDTEALAYLKRLVLEQPDATLAELAHRLEEHTSVGLHESTIWRYCKRLGLSYKKNATRH